MLFVFPSVNSWKAEPHGRTESYCQRTRGRAVKRTQKWRGAWLESLGAQLWSQFNTITNRITSRKRRRNSRKMGGGRCRWLGLKDHFNKIQTLGYRRLLNSPISTFLYDWTTVIWRLQRNGKQTIINYFYNVDQLQFPGECWPLRTVNELYLFIAILDIYHNSKHFTSIHQLHTKATKSG